MTIKKISKSTAQTIEIASNYASTLRPGDIVLLDGDMGAGKTMFAKGVALGLGIDCAITSPTYAYMNNYNDILYHYDCYRLTSGEDALSLGLADYFYANGICLIEWSQNIIDILPDNCKRVRINKINEDLREIEL